VKPPASTRRVRRRALLVSGLAAIAVIGCGSSERMPRPARTDSANAAPTTAQAPAATTTPASRPAERFDLGVATAALPPSWQLQSNADALAGRRQARAHGDPLNAAFIIVRPRPIRALLLFPWVGERS
jgi:hypothetical protein